MGRAERKNGESVWAGDGDLRGEREGRGGRLAPLCIPIDEIAPWPLPDGQ